MMLTAGLALAAAAGPAWAAECDGVRLPDTAQAGSAALVLNGMGIRKATFLKVHAYVAGLYLPARSGNADAIIRADQPWRLVLQFQRDVGAADMRNGFQEGFEKAAGAKHPELQPRIDTLKAALTEFKKGQQLWFTHAPGSGVQLTVNGQARPPIPGADFAAALLGASIGPGAPNAELKTGLLGGACG